MQSVRAAGTGKIVTNYILYNSDVHDGDELDAIMRIDPELDRIIAFAQAAYRQNPERRRRLYIKQDNQKDRVIIIEDGKIVNEPQVCALCQAEAIDYTRVYGPKTVILCQICIDRTIEILKALGYQPIRNNNSLWLGER